MSSLADKGFQLSKNAFFNYMISRASGLMKKPVKVGLLLTTAYEKLQDANSSESGVDQIKNIMFRFIRLVKAYYQGTYRGVSTKSILLGIAVLLYMVTPLDLIPDFIPLLGFADDLSLMAWFISAFQEELHKFQVWEEGAVGVGHC
ncbi:YkvA family protein [Rufibacter psychrotolerans]|uniref:YkvA family protein n=1 Tax=Rufibacter psychrotolerans TaxID=2812556 RepID=UPI0019684A2F|nr:YkvA family protein [Rufibacter sp. SYSU D00308]